MWSELIEDFLLDPIGALDGSIELLYDLLTLLIGGYTK